MTDRDPKDMTASELLRLADSDPCSMCLLVMTEDESCATTGCTSWAYRLADKIDAEIAKARELSLRQGAELWAKANGWPDFREGEDFGAWLDRCFIPRPRFEDGEPVQFGDEPLYLETIDEIDFYQDGTVTIGHDGNTFEVDPGEGVKRPAPEALGADGLPLNEDDTVYGTGREQHRYTVQVPYSINEEVGKRFCVQCYDHDEGNITWCDPSMLTHERPVLGADGKPIVVGETVWSIHGIHEGIVKALNVNMAYVEWSDGRWSPSILCDKLTHTPPDTQWDIDDDATMAPRDYYARYIGHDVGLKDDAEVTEAMVLDLLQRQRELDKRTGGAE